MKPTMFVYGIFILGLSNMGFAQTTFIKEEKVVRDIPVECSPMKQISSRVQEVKMFQAAQTVKKYDSRTSLVEKFGIPSAEVEFYTKDRKLDKITMLFNIHRRNLDEKDERCDTYIEAVLNNKFEVEKFSFHRGSPMYRIIQ